MKNAIEIKELVKTYDEKFTLGPITANIPSGEIIGLIGENGAGKTTLIKTLLNIIKPTSGSINIFEKNYVTEEDKIKEDIAVVLDDMFFPEILFVKDLDGIMAGIYSKWDSHIFYEYLEKFEINAIRKINDLSKGMRKKLEIAVALSHHPKLLILDEPTSGLDPIVRNEVLDIFLNFISDEDHTILFSTHITSDLEHIADRIIFVNKGQIILDDNRDNIMDDYGILKCDETTFATINQEDIIRYKKNRYDYEVLINKNNKITKKYQKCIIDKITLEDLMLLMIKGDK